MTVLAVKVPLVLTLVTFIFPNCIVLLAVTIALSPIAVAFSKLSDPTSALFPIAVLWLPVLLLNKALLPIDVL